MRVDRSVSEERKIAQMKNAFDNTAADGRGKKLKEAAQKGAIVKLDPSEIVVSENIRSNLDTESDSFLMLVESIRKYGILQNLVVEFYENDGAYQLVCVAGHRRLEAAKIAEIKDKIPVKLIDKTESQSSRGVALVENLNRENLHFLDIAEGYKQILDSNEMSKSELCLLFDRNPKTISRYLKMANWSLDAKKIILENQNVFTARVVLNEFAMKSFANDEELITALNKKLNDPKNKKKNSPKYEKKLEKYFEDRPEITIEQRTLVLDALKFLGLLRG